MELWIRSQNRRDLVKVDYVYMTEKSTIQVGSKQTGVGVVAEYKTKERALEVLDEIQCEISNYVGTMAQIVYEMPLN